MPKPKSKKGNKFRLGGLFRKKQSSLSSQHDDCSSEDDSLDMSKGNLSAMSNGYGADDGDNNVTLQTNTSRSSNGTTSLSSHQSDKENQDTSVRSASDINGVVSQSDLYMMNKPRSPMSLTPNSATSSHFPAYYKGRDRSILHDSSGLELKGGGVNFGGIMSPSRSPTHLSKRRHINGNGDKKLASPRRFGRLARRSIKFSNNTDGLSPSAFSTSDLSSTHKNNENGTFISQSGTATISDRSDNRAYGCTPFQNTWNVLCNIDGTNESMDNSNRDLDDGAFQNDSLNRTAERFRVKVDKRTGAITSAAGQQSEVNNPSASSDSHSLSLTASDSLVDSEEERRKYTDMMVLTRSALSRPFGRTSLPADIAKRWLVEVHVHNSIADATGDNEEETGSGKASPCKYDIMVQKEEFGDGNINGTIGIGKRHGHGSPSISSSSSRSSDNMMIQNELSISASFRTTAANVTRTLRDFLWLEQALRKEYHGSLLLPMLSLAIMGGADWTTALDLDKEVFERGEWDPAKMSNEILEEALCYNMDEPVDARLLADWLSDVLNGVRGKGELIMKYDPSSSYSATEMGAGLIDVFHSEAMEAFLYKTSGSLPSPRLSSVTFDEQKKMSPSRCDIVDGNSSWLKKNPQDFFSDFMRTNLSCLGNWDFGNDGDNASYSSYESDVILSRRNKIHVKQEDPTNSMWLKNVEIDEIKAQRFYISIQRENTLRVMYRLRILLEKEILLSAAWKRFAISLSMLFATEKDIEGCKIGDGKIKKKHTVSRTVVDNNLRILARQKVDRSVPSLKVLSGMLNAYYADFSSVDPSLREYSEALEEVAISNDGKKWRSHLKSLSPLHLLNGVADSDDSSSVQSAGRQATLHRLTVNENHMRSSLMQFCQAVKIRLSRMSWKFFKMESGQVSLLMNAADQVRTNLKNRNQPLPFDDEKLDNETEAGLVKQILNLGLKKGYKYQPTSKSCASSHTSSETSELSDYERSLEGESDIDDNPATQSPLVEKVMSLWNERMGQWDEELVQAILTAVGADDDVNLFEEDTSRDLRALNKLILALRESLSRCKDAIEMLQSIKRGDHNTEENDGIRNLKQTRERFLSDLTLLFSGTVASGQLDPLHENILSCVGIDIHDSDGWLNSIENHISPTEGKCGIVALKYQEIRAHGIEVFMDRMKIRLKDYEILIREMENYLWMHRIGAHLEQFYSRLRADALADWEKKTDITTAINIATKKRLTLLVKELKAKLATIGSSVSYTSVKKAKERHLGSKALKSSLEALASRRFQRLKETCTKNTLSIINEWALCEEAMAKTETKYLAEAIVEIERNVRRDNRVEADGGAHLFASSMATTMKSSRRGSFLDSNPSHRSPSIARDREFVFNKS